MGFRFRKSIKILPGVRVNIGKSGFSSVSVGLRGASVSFGKQGTYMNTSIPGTGISYREKLGGPDKVEKQPQQPISVHVSIHLSEDGTISATNGNGEALETSILNKALKEKSSEIKQWLEDEAEKLNDMQLITSIHFDIPKSYSIPTYKMIDFQEKAPFKPIKINVNKPSFLKILFSSKAKMDYQEKVLEAETAFNNAMDKWNKDLADFENKKQIHIKNEQKKAVDFSRLLRTDSDVMDEQLESVLQSLDWPRETLINYEISDDLQTLYVDIDLPEIEDMPHKVYTVASTGKKLNIKEKTQKTIKQEYATHIFAIALRVAAYSFANLPSILTVIITGYSQRVDKSTWHTEDQYLYAIKFKRTDLLQLNYNNLASIDLIEFIDKLEHIKSMTATGELKKLSIESVKSFMQK